MEEVASADPRLSRWRKSIGWIAGSLLLASVFVIFQPSDLLVALAIHLVLIVPLLALMVAIALRIGLFQAALADKDRIILLWPLLAGSFAMWFVMLLLQSFALSTGSYLPAAGALAAGLFLLIRFLQPEDLRSRALSLFMGAVVFIYGLGTVMVIDLYWIPFDAEIFESEVVTKSPESVSGHYLIVKPWGPVTEDDRIEVSEETYRKSEPGKNVQVRYKRGLLGKGWRSLSG